MRFARLLLLIALGWSSGVLAETILADGVRIDLDAGSLRVHGVLVQPPLDRSGRPVYLVPVSEVPSRAIADGRMLMRYLTKSGGAKERGFAVLEYRAEPVRVSNLLPLPEMPVWDDNNYVATSDAGLRFGVFAPNRLQFVYRNGVLAFSSDPWAGPSHPERYIEPAESERGPCFNVANVPECLAERERYEAAAQRPKRKGSQPPGALPASAASGLR